MTLEEIALRVASPRERPVELFEAASRATGVLFAGELAEWIRLFERFELEALEPSLAELRAPEASIALKSLVEAEEASWIAGVVSIFTATSIVAQQDEVSYLAAWAPTASGRSKIYHFHPEDWGMWPTDPSLAARIHRLVEDDKRSPELALKKLSASDAAQVDAAILALREKAERLDPRLDPERLFPRVAWLVHLFLAHGNDWKAELAQAATIEDYENERALIASWPHLALYWLWSHAMFGNASELEEVFALTASSQSALVQESRELIERLEDGREVRLGARTTETFEGFREQLQDEAPAGVLGSGAKQRRDAREQALLATEDEETRMLAGLEDIAAREPKVREALRLLRALEEGGLLRPAALKAETGLTLEEAVERFVALVDHRFRSLLLVKLRRASRWGDASAHATHGLVLAFQRLAKNFDEFESVLRAVGTGNFGARRLTELFRAYGRFEGARATARLAELTRAYLEEMESWEPKTPPEAALELFAREGEAVEAAIATVLERASFSGANAAVAVRAAEAAGRLASARAVKGLERAVERELGRIDDGTRARVIAALVACAGADALPFLRGLCEARIARWEAEEDRRGSYVHHHKDVACWTAGLFSLSAAASDRRLVEKAREMLAAFHEELSAAKKARRDVIYASAALLRGIGNARVSALREAVAPFAALSLREDRATLGLGEMLSKLAGEVLARL